MWKHSGSVGLIGRMHPLITPMAPLTAASTKSQVTLYRAQSRMILKIETKLCNNC